MFALRPYNRGGGQACLVSTIIHWNTTMRLLSLKFEDPQAGWSLDEIAFFPDVTLLVGLSGVGKTRILETVRRLQRLAAGNSGSANWGIKWELRFSTNQNEYVWSGEVEEPKGDGLNPRFAGLFTGLNEGTPSPLIKRESLRRGQVLAERNGDTITLDGKETPKLPREESLLHILRNEESIAEAHAALDSVLYVDHVESPATSRYSFPGPNWDSLKKKLNTVELIRKKDIPTRFKLALAYENCRKVFDSIVSQFQDAFPYVTKLELDVVEIGGPFGKAPRLVLHEEGVESPIPEEAISSGMLRTLMHLSRMALWPDGTVVLIDEFENSLGVNCINFVTQDLQTQSKRLQFILTSHHPYIINNIDMKNWKIVSRSGKVVSVNDSSLLSTNSRHDAFLQLLNLPEYAKGISTS